MSRLSALAALLALPAVAPAQAVVVTSHYLPPPPPRVVVSAYAAPVVVARPPVAYVAAPPVVTYRQPLLRPRATVVRVWPGAAVPAAPVTAAYPPAVIVP